MAFSKLKALLRSKLPASKFKLDVMISRNLIRMMIEDGIEYHRAFAPGT